MAFHRYPQLIRTFCNRSRFGPPQACSARFSLAMGRSPSFGSIRTNSSPFRTRFRSGSACPWLSLARTAHSSAHSTKGTPSPQHLRGGSDRPEAQGFRICFTPLAGVLFTVPSRYWCTIGRWRYLALGGGPPRFPPDFSCPAVLTIRDHPPQPGLAYGALTRSGRPFQWRSALQIPSGEGSTAPSITLVQPSYGSASQLNTPHKFGLLPVRSPLLGESSLLLAVLRCFTSRGSLPDKPGDGPCAHRVAPFGSPRISGCQRLPWAFRRVAASFLGRHRQGIHPAPVSRTPHNAPVPYTLSRPGSLLSFETPDRLAPAPGRTHH